MSSLSPLSERVDDHFRDAKVALLDAHGMMRHVLDSLGALKVRLADDRTVTETELNVFAGAVKVFVDHVTGFEPIDAQSGVCSLVDAFPDESKRRDGRGWLPLHWAAAVHDTSNESLAEIIEQRPLATHKGHLPVDLRSVDMPNNDTNHGDNKLTEDGQLVHHGLLPLHLVASLKHPVFENVRQMLKAYPEASSLPDHRGWLPIHWCAVNGRNIEVLKLLAKTYPDGCFTPNKKGKLPLQLAGRNRLTEVIDVLLEQNPEALNSVDYNGNTIMHEATKTLNFEVVRKLLNLQPELAMERNFKEDLPLHKVFTHLDASSTRLHYRQLETVKALLLMNPETAALTDAHDTLPLMMAVFFNSSLDVIEMLYNVYPSAALVKDPQGNLPVHYAKSPAVKQLLLKASPPLVRAGLSDSFSRFTQDLSIPITATGTRGGGGLGFKGAGALDKGIRPERLMMKNKIETETDASSPLSIKQQQQQQQRQQQQQQLQLQLSTRDERKSNGSDLEQHYW